MSNLTPADVDAVCDLVDNLCGLCWDSSKAYLIESRLTNILLSPATFSTLPSRRWRIATIG